MAYLASDGVNGDEGESDKARAGVDLDGKLSVQLVSGA